MIEYINISYEEYKKLSDEERKEPYCIEYNNEIKYYKVNEILHREDGPAIIYFNRSRSWEWFINGERHREDGPAYFDGNQILWYLNNKKYSFEKWLKLTPISDEEVIFLKLKYL